MAELTYFAIQFRTEVEPLKETTISLSTGSMATMPLVSATAPLIWMSESVEVVKRRKNIHERGDNRGVVRGEHGALVQFASDWLTGSLLIIA